MSGLFSDVLAASGPTATRVRLARAVSLAVHSAALALVMLAPVLLPSALPERGDILATLVYDPPPPPPAPLPRGSPLRAEQARPSQPATEKPASTFTAPIERPAPIDAKQPPESGIDPDEQFGSQTGSVLGSELGTEDGVPGGVPGGTPGGVPGGVPGGTGTGPAPVSDYDAPPTLVRQTKPLYPQEAFVKKVEGAVEIEILIDSFGRVVGARVVRSIPLLDAAALACVREWTFHPAVRHGVTVPTLARAPVRFRIY